MFCPQCGAEYRPGFTRCADCDVPLVADPPPSNRDVGAREPVEAENYEIVWQGGDQNDCVSICQAFRSAGIPYHVFQHGDPIFRTATYDFQIAAPANSREAARNAIEEIGLGPGDDEPDQDSIALPAELPAQDDAPNPGEPPGPPGPAAGADGGLVEIWRGNQAGLGSMIEASLRENDIPLATESSPGGSQGIFVHAHDEPRAREIVREIREASPPQ